MTAAYTNDVFLVSDASARESAKVLHKYLAARSLKVSSCAEVPWREYLKKCVGFMESSAVAVLVMQTREPAWPSSELEDAVVERLLREPRSFELMPVLLSGQRRIGKTAVLHGLRDLGEPVVLHGLEDQLGLDELVLRLRGLSTIEIAKARASTRRSSTTFEKPLVELDGVLQGMRAVQESMAARSSSVERLPDIPKVGRLVRGPSRLLALMLDVRAGERKRAFDELLGVAAQLWTQLDFVEDVRSVEQAQQLMSVAHHVTSMLAAHGARTRVGDEATICFEFLVVTKLLQDEALAGAGQPLLGELVFSESQRRQLSARWNEGAIDRQQRRTGFLERRMRGESSPRPTDGEVARRLGISEFGLETLRSSTPSVAALRQLERATGYAESQ